MRKISAAALACITLAFCLLFAMPPLEAGGCYSGYTYANNYSYSQPYYTPTYQQAYYTPQYQYVTKYVDREVAVPYPVKALLSQDYYFAHADSYQVQAAQAQSQLVADAAAFRALSVLANLNGGQATNRKTARVGQQVPAPYDPRVPQTPTPQSQGIRAQPKAGGTVPVGLAEIVEASCIKCHNGSDSKRLDLSNLDTVAKVDRFSSWEQVNSGEMPRGAKPLPDTSERLFREWAKAGKK